MNPNDIDTEPIEYSVTPYDGLPFYRSADAALPGSTFWINTPERVGDEGETVTMTATKTTPFQDDLPTNLDSMQGYLLDQRSELDRQAVELDDEIDTLRSNMDAAVEREAAAKLAFVQAQHAREEAQGELDQAVALHSKTVQASDNIGAAINHISESLRALASNGQ